MIAAGNLAAAGNDRPSQDCADRREA